MNHESNYEIVSIDNITTAQIASICDHTFLKRSEEYRETAKPGESPIRLREEAFEKFLESIVNMLSKPYAVCVRSEEANRTKKFLDANHIDVKIASVVGFPKGTWYSTESKVKETELAILMGATEIDMVINHNALMHIPHYAQKEISLVSETAHKAGALVKVILEVSELQPWDMIQACDMCNEAGADFVKTSTGYSVSGATCESLKIMREYFPRGVKMSGGVKTENVKDLLKAASGRDDGMILLDPSYIRIGESKLLV